MNKKHVWYKELPLNYQEVYHIDAKDTKTGILLNLAALVLGFAVYLILIRICQLDYRTIHPLLSDGKFLLVYIVSMLSYIVLHELTHGLAYKHFCPEKLTFGISLSAAFCGMPSIYMRKKPMVIAALAPFVIYTLIGLAVLIFSTSAFVHLWAILFLVVHIAGCIGDLYISGLMLLKYPDDLLVNDTGAKQTFYLPKKETSNDSNNYAETK